VNPGIPIPRSKQTKPFSSIEEEAFLALPTNCRPVTGRVAEWLKTWGLSPTQYNALRILRGAGEDGLACSEIAERMSTAIPILRGCWIGWRSAGSPAAAGMQKTGE